MTATKGPGFEPVAAIAGRAPVPSILTSARNRTADGFGGNWQSGISWRSTQSLASYGRELCGTGDLVGAPVIDKP